MPEYCSSVRFRQAAWTASCCCRRCCGWLSSQTVRLMVFIFGATAFALLCMWCALAAHSSPHGNCAVVCIAVSGWTGNLPEAHCCLRKPVMMQCDRSAVRSTTRLASASLCSRAMAWLSALCSALLHCGCCRSEPLIPGGPGQRGCLFYQWSAGHELSGDRWYTIR